MHKILVISGMVFISACSNPSAESTPKDSLSGKDSIKKAMQENLPPSSDIRQFNWFYSAFAQAATSGNDSLFNVVIHPKHGLWIIHSEGAVPNFTKVMRIRDYKNMQGKGLLPFDRDAMMTAPKEEALPVIDCNSKNFYNKTGCFTQMQNSFAQEKIWLNAGLDADRDKEIAQLASTIMRTVINTENHYKFYFSLIDGTWYLTFIDIRTPCDA
ncbi:MAG TPA: hypothetical protein VFJ43_01055 [Bacteroidia bacterium]|nr:hypothetical protein [Bacteroidia bacterium]